MLFALTAARLAISAAASIGGARIAIDSGDEILNPRVEYGRERVVKLMLDIEGARLFALIHTW